MNYRHAFHAGNHADVLKHVVLLALCDALTAKPAPCFALDTHGGRGLYKLDGESAQKTGEAQDGIARLVAESPRDPAVQRYLTAVRACRQAHGSHAYPGSPWLLAHALREQDHIAACELLPEEAAVLSDNFARDPRVSVHARDGYAAIKAMLPPKHGATRFARGLVLIDPPYEAQLDEFDIAIKALREGLSRFEPGAQGEHKLARGFLPAIVRSRHWIADPRFAAALRDWCGEERRGVRDYVSTLAARSPFKAVA